MEGLGKKRLAKEEVGTAQRQSVLGRGSWYCAEAVGTGQRQLVLRRGSWYWRQGRSVKERPFRAALSCRILGFSPGTHENSTTRNSYFLHYISLKPKAPNFQK